MTLPLLDSSVELRFQVSTVLLQAACQAIAPYVTTDPAWLREQSRPPAGTLKVRSQGVTQAELEMLLQGSPPKP